MWPPADTDLDALEVIALAEGDGVVTAPEGARTSSAGSEPRETTPDEAWPWLQVDELEALERFASASPAPARSDPLVPQDDGGRPAGVPAGEPAPRDTAGDVPVWPARRRPPAAVVGTPELPSPPESGIGPPEPPAPVTIPEGLPGRGARLFDDTAAPAAGEREAARSLRVAIVGAAVILALASAWAAGWIGVW